MWRRIAAVSALTVLLAVYLLGAMRQAQRVNTDPRRGDQSAYLRAAVAMRASGFRDLGDRNRMPLYPALQALFLERKALAGGGAHPPFERNAASGRKAPSPPFERNAASGEEAASAGVEGRAFERAKRINILLSLVLLAALAPILRAWLPWRQTLGLLAVTAFSVFMFKAGWVQAELLFYVLSFALWLLLVALLVRPRLELGVLAGVLAGLAYLTKASILPALALWAVWSVAAAAGDLRRGLSARARARLAATGAVVLLALAVLFPYLSDTRRIYGHWFYNVNTTFGIWCDSWAEMKSGPRAHGALEGWPDMPAEEIPSMRRYLRTHSAGQIAGRLAQGSRAVFERAAHGYGYFAYAVFYVVLAAYLALRNRAWSRDLVKRHTCLAGFLASYFLLSFLLVAWYVPIASGSRFILAHFLPLIFGACYLAARAPATLLLGRPVVPLANRAILVALAIDLPLRLLPHASSLSGGH